MVLEMQASAAMRAWAYGGVQALKERRAPASHTVLHPAVAAALLPHKPLRAPGTLANATLLEHPSARASLRQGQHRAHHLRPVFRPRCAGPLARGGGGRALLDDPCTSMDCGTDKVCKYLDDQVSGPGSLPY